MDNREYDLNLWEKVIEKAVNIEVKASLQSLFRAKGIDFICLKSYRPLAKKDKDEVNWEH